MWHYSPFARREVLSRDNWKIVQQFIPAVLSRFDLEHWRIARGTERNSRCEPVCVVLKPPLQEIIGLISPYINTIPVDGEPQAVMEAYRYLFVEMVLLSYQTIICTLKCAWGMKQNATKPQPKFQQKSTLCQDFCFANSDGAKGEL